MDGSGNTKVKNASEIGALAGRLNVHNQFYVLNTINFKKSMNYNPLAYIHSEKDILKLVNCLILNTKGEGKSNDPFWESATRSLTVRSQRTNNGYPLFGQLVIQQVE